MTLEMLRASRNLTQGYILYLVNIFYCGYGQKYLLRPNDLKARSKQKHPQIWLVLHLHFQKSIFEQNSFKALLIGILQNSKRDSGPTFSKCIAYHFAYDFILLTMRFHLLVQWRHFLLPLTFKEKDTLQQKILFWTHPLSTYI